MKPPPAKIPDVPEIPEELIKKLPCGCEIGAADGYPYATCELHIEFAPPAAVQDLSEPAEVDDDEDEEADDSCAYCGKKSTWVCEFTFDDGSACGRSLCHQCRDGKSITCARHAEERSKPSAPAAANPPVDGSPTRDGVMEGIDIVESVLRHHWLRFGDGKVACSYGDFEAAADSDKQAARLWAAHVAEVAKKRY